MRPPVVQLGRDECLRLLATQSVGRLAFVSDAGAEVQPVNFVLDGDAIVFATSPGQKLWSLSRGPVSFEVDVTDPAHRTGWSVVVRGIAAEVLGPELDALVARVGELANVPWPAGEHPNVVRIPADIVTGRRVAADVVTERPEHWIG